MFERLAVAAVAAVVAIGAFTFGASLLTRPTDPAENACPPTLTEADAVDAFAPGLSQTERAWASRDGVPRVRPGYIALFASTPPLNDPGMVILLHPVTGARCHLIRLASQHPIGYPVTSVDWSPSGDALALALAGAEGADGQEDGVVLVWTPDRLQRIWSGEGSPRLEWAPDGRSIAIWASDGSLGPDGTPDNFDTRLIFADGSPDRSFDFFPVDDSLRWSPDGSRWVVAEAIEQDIVPDTAVSIVEVSDGRTSPLDLGRGHFRPVSWTSDGTLVVQTVERGQGVTGYLEIATDDPSSSRILFGAGENLGIIARPSPDGTQLLYVSNIDENGSGELKVRRTAAGPGDPGLSLAPGMEVGEVGFAWSPDGSQVAFHALDEGLWTVNADGTGLRQISSGGLVMVDDPWQPVAVR